MQNYKQNYFIKKMALFRDFEKKLKIFEIFLKKVLTFSNLSIILWVSRLNDRVKPIDKVHLQVNKVLQVLHKNLIHFKFCILIFSDSQK